MSLEGVLEKVRSLNIPLVELTGGEPLAQQNSIPLLKALIREGYKVLIETSGAHCISSVPRDVSIIMDLKCPDSKMCERNLWSNLEHLKPEDEIKFVVASREDFEWALQVTRQRDLEQKFKLLFSPAWGLVDPKDLVSWLRETRVQARENLQLHKNIWSPKTKGVKIPRSCFFSFVVHDFVLLPTFAVIMSRREIHTQSQANPEITQPVNEESNPGANRKCNNSPKKPPSHNPNRATDLQPGTSSLKDSISPARRNY